MPWLEIIGWVGSILVVVSLMQARVLRFRWLNFVGAVIATGYNAVIEVWPFAAMNGAIAAIDAYWLWRLYSEAHDAAAYQAVQVRPDDAYLAHVLSVNAADIAATHPRFDIDAWTSRAARDPVEWSARHAAWLVVRGDETVGVVLVRPEGEVGNVELDWVSPRFRDFTPGEFVYRESSMLTEQGLSTVVVTDPESSSLPYLRRVGFEEGPGGRWSRSVGI